METPGIDNINKNMSTYNNKINFETSNEDKTFNKLKKIQSLLKKESALKELCKHFNHIHKFIYSHKS